eukprot:SAG31_NODE_9561_length_1258_cov_2.832614_1_plen_27_part_10
MLGVKLKMDYLNNFIILLMTLIDLATA